MLVWQLQQASYFSAPKSVNSITFVSLNPLKFLKALLYNDLGNQIRIYDNQNQCFIINYL